MKSNATHIAASWTSDRLCSQAATSIKDVSTQFWFAARILATVQRAGQGRFTEN